MSNKDCETGRQWGFYARDHGAAKVQEIKTNGHEKTWVESYDGKAVIFSSGQLEPHASHHIGAIIKWMLRIALTLALLFGGYAWAIRL